MKHNTIEARIFLVGCPRSGTTLLQSLLAAHSDIVSFPESKFFQELVYPGSRRSKLKLISGNARNTFNKFLDDIGHQEMSCLLPKTALFTHQYTKVFINILDILTEREGKHFWLEKTPSHLQRINQIENSVEKAKFVHIIRQGADVVASLYETTNKYPEVWGGPRNIDRCIKRWINDIRISYSHVHKSNHLLISYERLVEETQLLLKEVCQFLGVTFSEAMLQNYSISARSLIRKHELWKGSVSKNIQKANYRKFDELFDKSQRQYISQKLATINLEKLTDYSTAPNKTDCHIF